MEGDDAGVGVAEAAQEPQFLRFQFRAVRVAAVAPELVRDERRDRLLHAQRDAERAENGDDGDGKPFHSIRSRERAGKP